MQFKDSKIAVTLRFTAVFICSLYVGFNHVLLFIHKDARPFILPLLEQAIQNVTQLFKEIFPVLYL